MPYYGLAAIHFGINQRDYRFGFRPGTSLGRYGDFLPPPTVCKPFPRAMRWVIAGCGFKA
jgi:hypothetical protein